MVWDLGVGVYGMACKLWIVHFMGRNDVEECGRKPANLLGKDEANLRYRGEYQTLCKFVE